MNADEWPPPGMPGLPNGLWLSTLVILLTSVSIQLALNAIRSNNQKSLLNYLLITNGLGFLFLILQIINWWSLVQLDMTITANLYGFTFYVLTGLHAVHVVGGIIPLLVTARKAQQGFYTSQYYNGVYYSCMYWHFLDAVWIVMYTTLLIYS